VTSYSVSPSDAPVAFAAAIDPATISGISFRYRAEDVAGADGASVSSWPDSSGLAKDLSQATVANQPVIKRAVAALGGRDGVLFDGVNDNLIRALLAGENLPSGGTMFLVASQASQAGQQRPFTLSRPGPGLRSLIALSLVAGGPSFNFRDDAGINFGVSAPSLGTVGTPFISDGYCTPLAMQTTMNNAPGTKSATAAGISSQTQATMGAIQTTGAFTGFWNGHIVELIFYDHVLTEAERDGVRAWLAASVGGIAPGRNGDRGQAADVVSAQSIAVRAAADAATAVDSAERASSSARGTTDTAPAVDMSSRFVPYGRATADTAHAIDSATRSSSTGRGTTDTAPAVESVTRAGGYGRASTDTAPAIDTTSRIAGLCRGTPDTAGAVDGAAYVYVPLRVHPTRANLGTRTTTATIPARATISVLG
jgi:hypothetical protein